MNEADSKATLRTEMQRARSNQPDKDRLSFRVTDRLVALPEYQSARSVMWYVDVRDEVRTRAALFAQLELASETTVANETEQHRRFIVPFCIGSELGLFEIRCPSELVPGRFGILEPREQLRNQADRVVLPSELDLVVVPGVAFDRSGNRLGHGKGFYDRCLQATRHDTLRVGLAFHCQVISKVPIQPHDIAMERVLTENEAIECVGG